MAKIPPDDLLKLLRLHPREGSAELCERLGGISRATFMRLIKAAGERIVAAGNARRARYALRRPLRGNITPLPLYQIDADGQGHEIGLLSLTHPEGSVLEFSAPFLWPLDRNMADGWFDGLPYPITDMRPQGFLGRNFARNHALDLGVSDNPEHWSDDDIAHVLATTGFDQPGNLILGETAYRRFLEYRRTGSDRFLADALLATEYPRLANLAIAGGEAGSSAGGEFPKFTTGRMIGNRKKDVIVKFSGEDASKSVRRWADLLVCEHLSAKIMSQTLGISAAASAIHQYAGRTFLEVIRFDRHGELGRSGTCSVGSLNAALIGAAGLPWFQTAIALHKAGTNIPHETIQKIRLIWWFGKLIANTDMHEGNLAFRPDMTLTPVFDMLPMLYAPLRGGEVPERTFTPELPMPADQLIWKQAAQAAIEYWQRCATDERIGNDFRSICKSNADAIESVF